MPPKGQKPQKAKKQAPAPVKKSIAKAEDTSLFGPVKRNYGIGGAIQPRRDLSRMLKWPRYIRLQRQRKVLKMRLKVPPSIAQFSSTTDLNTGERPAPLRALSLARPQPSALLPARLRSEAARWGCLRGASVLQSSPADVLTACWLVVCAATNIFRLLDKYKPEEKKAKKERLASMVRLTANPRFAFRSVHTGQSRRTAGRAARGAAGGVLIAAAALGARERQGLQHHRRPRTRTLTCCCFGVSGGGQEQREQAVLREVRPEPRDQACGGQEGSAGGHCSRR